MPQYITAIYGSQHNWSGLICGTLEEWAKKSNEEFAAIEEEIREIRELLDEP